MYSAQVTFDSGRLQEYVCTCCDQLWYKSSVVKCNANKYKLSSVVKSFHTGFKSVNDIEGFA